MGSTSLKLNGRFISNRNGSRKNTMLKSIAKTASQQNVLMHPSIIAIEAIAGSAVLRPSLILLMRTIAA
jgi:hypothetical protein